MDARPTVTATPRRDPATAEVLLLGGGLLLLGLLAKCVLLPFPVETASQAARWLLRWGIVASQDVCFAVAMTLLAMLTLRASASRPRVQRVLRVKWQLAFLFAGLYTIVNVAVLRTLMIPLNWPVLQLAGGPRLMWSSLQTALSPSIVAALILVPLVAAGVWLLLRKQNLPLLTTRPAVLWTLGLLTAAYGITCQSYIQANWTDPNRWERRISASPHYVMLASMVSAAAGTAPGLNDRPMPADAQDFFFSRNGQRPASEKPLPTGNRPLPKNVLLIVIESTGVEYLSLYGSPYETTPHLEQLVQEHGVVCENAYVQSPNSCKSLLSLLCGISPRVDGWLTVRDQPDLEVESVMEVLAGQGMRSCLAHAGAWRWKDRDRFLRLQGAGATLIDADSLDAPAVNSWGVSDRAMFDGVLDWIDAGGEQPFFALAYTIETHHPYEPGPAPRKFVEKPQKLNDYLNALRRTDETIAYAVQELKNRGLLDSTLIVVTSDHGESFGQHDQWMHNFSLYESATHVPLVLIHPSLADAPRRPQAIRQHLDIPTTVVSLLGYESPASWQGRTLWPWNEDRRAYFFCIGNQPILGMRDGAWKYHFQVETGHEELFDLARDPGELQNLAPSQSERCAQFRGKLAAFVENTQQLHHAANND